jgi:hypothetical protein
MLADKRYTVSKIHINIIERHPQLVNRVQLWKLQHDGEEKNIALAHLPFAGDEHHTTKSALSAKGQQYCDLINIVMRRYQEKNFIFCADFNFNPYLISEWHDRVLDKISPNNSLLLTVEKITNKRIALMATVDGVLLSLREKQRYQTWLGMPKLFSTLKLEYSFFQSQVKQAIKDVTQVEHENGLSIVKYTYA